MYAMAYCRKLCWHTQWESPVRTGGQMELEAREKGLGQIFKYHEYHSRDLELYLLSPGKVVKPDSDVGTFVFTGWCRSKTGSRGTTKATIPRVPRKGNWDVQWNAQGGQETFPRLNPQDLGRIRLSRDRKGRLEEIQSPSQEQEEDHTGQEEREQGQRAGNLGAKQHLC